MAYLKKTNWVAVYKMPADDYQHEHLSMVESFGQSPADARAILVKHTNPDIRVVKLYPMQSHQQFVDELGRIEASPGHRPLQDSEQLLTARASHDIRKAAGMSVDNIVLPKIDPSDPARAIAEANADVFSDPPPLIALS